MVRARKPQPDGRGGPRQGVPGRQYPQRSDLRSGQGDQYGAVAARQESLKAVPMAQAPSPEAAAANPPPTMIGPDDTPTLRGPSNRPDEPLTAGLPFGEGRNPSPYDSTADPVGDDMVDRLRALYLAHPTRELRELLEQVD